MPVFTWKKDSKDRSGSYSDPRSSHQAEDFRRNAQVGGPNATNPWAPSTQQLNPSPGSNSRPGTSRLGQQGYTNSNSPFLLASRDRAAASSGPAIYRASSSRSASPSRIQHAFGSSSDRPATASSLSASKQQLNAYQVNRPPTTGGMGMSQDHNLYNRVQSAAQVYGLSSPTQAGSPHGYGMKGAPSSIRTNRPSSRYGIMSSGPDSPTNNSSGTGLLDYGNDSGPDSNGLRHAWHDSHVGSPSTPQPHSPMAGQYPSTPTGTGSGRLLGSFVDGGAAQPMGLPPQSPSRVASSLKYMPRSSSARQEQHTSLLATLMVHQVGAGGDSSPTHTTNRSLAFSPSGSPSKTTRKASSKGPARSMGSATTAGKMGGHFSARPGTSGSSQAGARRAQTPNDHLLQRRFSTGSVAGQQWAEHLRDGTQHAQTGVAPGHTTAHHPTAMDSVAWNVHAGHQAGFGQGSSRIAESGTLTCVRPSTGNASNFALAFAAESQQEFSTAMHQGANSSQPSTPGQHHAPGQQDEPLSPGAWGHTRPSEYQPPGSSGGSGAAALRHTGSNQSHDWQSYQQANRPHAPAGGSPTKSGRAYGASGTTGVGAGSTAATSSSQAAVPQMVSYSSSKGSHTGPGPEPVHPGEWTGNGRNPASVETGSSASPWSTPANDGTWASSGQGSETASVHYPSDTAPQQSLSVDESAGVQVPSVGEHVRQIRTKPRQPLPPQPQQHAHSVHASTSPQPPTPGSVGSQRPNSSVARHGDDRPTTPALDHHVDARQYMGAAQSNAWAAAPTDHTLASSHQAQPKTWQTLSPPTTITTATAHHDRSHDAHPQGLPMHPPPPAPAPAQASSSTTSTHASKNTTQLLPPSTPPAATSAAAQPKPASQAAAPSSAPPAADTKQGSETSTNPLHMFANLASKRVPVYPPRLPNAQEEASLLSNHVNSEHTAALPGYTVGKVIGEGGFCQVRLAVHRLSGRRVAIKVIDKMKLADAAEARRIQREIRVMRHLSHECVVKLFEVVDAPTILYLVMEHAPSGSLLDYVRSRKRLAEADAVTVVQQVVSGLSYCHQREVVHRDIKLENILLDSNNCMKLIDFGLSAFFIPGKQLRVHCGSPSYAAPEIVSRKHYDGPPVDVWSLGVVLFAMLAGHLPFHSSSGNKQELCSKIIEGRYTCPEHISAHGKELLSRMLCVEPSRRITLEQIAQHPWMNSGPRWEALGASIYMVRVDPGAGLVYADEQLVMELEAAGYNRQAILQYLLSGDANYVTAAYFLLAEGKAEVLRRMRGAQAAQRYIARGVQGVPAIDTGAAGMPLTPTIGAGGALSQAPAPSPGALTSPKLITGVDKGMLHGSLQTRTSIPAAVPT